MFSPTDKITILGMSGCGKSTLCQKIQSTWPRIVVFDRLREYQSEKGADVAHVSTFKDYCHAIRWSIGRARFKIIYGLGVDADDSSEEFDEACRILYHRGDTCAVIEEVWNFADTSYIPRWLKEIYLTGRHEKIGSITTSQRPAEVHKVILGQSHHVFCGQLHDKNDVDYLARSLGPQNAAMLPGIGKYRFLHYRPGFPVKIVSN